MIRYWHWLVAQKKETLNSEDYYHIWATMNDNSRVLIKQYPKTQPLTSISGLFSDDIKSNIIEIEFDENLQYVTNANLAFANLTNLQTIDFAENTNFTSLQNANYMFYSCNNLNFNCISNCLFEGVTTSSFMFGGILHNIDFSLPLAKFNNTINTNYMFGESTFTNISLPNSKFENVTNAEGMFRATRSVHTITLKDESGLFDKVTNASYMFAASGVDDCSFTNAIFANATNISYMFREIRINNITLPNATFEKATNAEKFISMADGVESINLASATFEKVTNGNYMFNIFGGTVETLSLPSATFESLNRCKYMFDSPLIETISMPLASFSSVSNISNNRSMFAYRDSFVGPMGSNILNIILPSSCVIDFSINIPIRLKSLMDLLSHLKPYDANVDDYPQTVYFFSNEDSDAEFLRNHNVSRQDVIQLIQSKGWNYYFNL